MLVADDTTSDRPHVAAVRSDVWEGMRPASRADELRRYRDERLMIARYGKAARDILWVGAKPSDYARACDRPAALTRFVAAALGRLVTWMRSLWRAVDTAATRAAIRAHCLARRHVDLDDASPATLRIGALVAAANAPA